MGIADGFEVGTGDGTSLGGVVGTAVVGSADGAGLGGVVGTGLGTEVGTGVEMKKATSASATSSSVALTSTDTPSSASRRRPDVVAAVSLATADTSVSRNFPLLIAVLIPCRIYWLPRLFTPAELDALDPPEPPPDSAREPERMSPRVDPAWPSGSSTLSEADQAP